MIHGAALQTADFDGPLVVTMQDAGALTQNIHGANAGTACTQNVCVENTECGAAQISGGYFLDETGNIDMGWAGRGARRVETIEAPVRFHERGLGIERRMYFGEALRDVLAWMIRHPECIVTFGRAKPTDAQNRRTRKIDEPQKPSRDRKGA
jgi:hypothetical protein